MTEIELREKLAHIDQMLSDNERILVDTKRINADLRRIEADSDRKRQEIKYQPVLAMISGMTAGAALVGATAAFIKIFGG